VPNVPGRAWAHPPSPDSTAKPSSKSSTKATSNSEHVQAQINSFMNHFVYLQIGSSSPATNVRPLAHGFQNAYDLCACTLLYPLQLHLGCAEWCWFKTARYPSLRVLHCGTLYCVPGLQLRARLDRTLYTASKVLWLPMHNCVHI